MGDTEAFLLAAEKADEILVDMSIPVDLGNREQLLQSASTSLNSKVVGQSADILAPIAVDAVLKIIDPKTANNVDLNDIKLVKKAGGTTDDFCAKAKILVVRDIEREDIDFISRTLGVEPVASLDHFTADKLAVAGLVYEESVGGEGSIVRF